MQRLVTAFAFALPLAVRALDNGVGLVPAMGYNTWNDFRCDGISAANITRVVDRMAELGLRRLGYEYVNIDDCWAVDRDHTTHKIIPDPVAFPEGMKAVADYVHSKGFKFGIYTDRGNMTCAKRPGSQGYESVDAQTYADWGVDYLKEDSCFATGDHEGAFGQYALMRDALNKTGRPIYFSLCGWSTWYAPKGYELGNSWRIAGDVNVFENVLIASESNKGLAEFARPGGWNDPDMLVGTSPDAAVHITEAQSRTQFGLWAVMAAPLLIGSNILGMNSFDFETYTNVEVIAVDQDPMGKQGEQFWSNCDSTFLSTLFDRSQDLPDCQQVWYRELADGTAALALINLGPKPTTVTCGADCLKAMGIAKPSLRDLWAHEDIGPVAGPISFEIPADGAHRLFKVSEAKN